MTTREFCEKYKIKSPSWKGDVKLAASEFLRLDAIKYKMIKDYVKEYNNGK